MSDVEKILILLFFLVEAVLIVRTGYRTSSIEDRLDRIERIKDEQSR